MAYLQIDGVTIPVFKDSLTEDALHIGEINGRAAGGGLHRSYTTRKRRWKFRTNQIEASEAVKMRDWIEGRGQAWLFDGNHLSGAGVGNSIAGTVTDNVSGGKHDGRITVASASNFTVNMGNKAYRKTAYVPTTHGYSWSFWRYNIVGVGEDNVATGWYHYLLTGYDAYARNSAANPAGVTQYRNGVAGSYNVGYYTSIDASGAFALYGYKSTSATSADRDYDDEWIAPYVVPSTWVTGLYTWQNSYAIGSWPFMRADGDFIEDSAPVEVLCTVESVDQMTAKLLGAANLTTNNRILIVTMEER